MPYLRQSHNVKPVRWGSEADVQYAIAKNSEKIYGVDPDSNVLTMPLFFGFPCLDFSGKQNHGTPYGGVAYHSGSLNFDGVDDYVGATDKNSLDIVDDLTLSVWIKTTDNNTLRGIIGKDTDTSLNICPYTLYYNSGEVRFLMGQGTSFALAETNTVENNGTWKHIVATIDNTNILKIYINSVQTGTTPTFSGTRQSNNNELWIGKMPLYNGVLSALIDEVRINNIVLTAEQNALFYARKWDLYRRVGRTYYSVAAAPSIYIPRIMIF